MAVDKLVDSTQLDSDLTSVANAIRTKGGTSAQLAFPSGFVSAIDAIPTGGGGSSEFEPCVPLGTLLSEIPDLSGLSRSSQVLYIVVDTSRSDTDLYKQCGIRPTVACTAEIGHMSNGSFVVDETETITAAQYWFKTLNKNGERFWVIRITSSSNITRIDANAILTSYQPIVAFYGYLPYCTSAGFIAQNENLMIIDIKGLLVGLVGGTQRAYIVKLPDYSAALVTNMFYTNDHIEEVDMSDWNIDSSTSLGGLFYNTRRLKKVKFGTHHTSSVTTIQNMLNGAICLNHIDISGLDLSGVTTTTSAFYGLPNLTDIDGWTPIKVSYGFTHSNYLTHDSLMKVINSLPTVQTSQTLTIGSTNLARLSSDEIAVATGKGWTVA